MRYSSLTLTQSIGTWLRVKKTPVGLRSGMIRERWRIGVSVSEWSSDRKSTRLNSSHTEIYTLSLHDALPISVDRDLAACEEDAGRLEVRDDPGEMENRRERQRVELRSEEHTSELQSHRDLHSFPTRRSSDLSRSGPGCV